jgi:hypothetical protein
MIAAKALQSSMRGRPPYFSVCRRRRAQRGGAGRKCSLSSAVGAGRGWQNVSVLFCFVLLQLLPSPFFLKKSISQAQASGARVSADDWAFPDWDITRPYITKPRS